VSRLVARAPGLTESRTESTPPPPSPDEEDPERESSFRALATAQERLAGRDFSTLSPDELAQLVVLMRQLRLATPLRRSRRYEAGSRGRRVDLRTTLRRAQRTGGYPVTLARHRLNLANLLDDAASSGVGAFVVSPPPTADAELNERLEVLVDAQADVCARRGVPFVDCYAPLMGHDQWRTDLAASSVENHPGQAGYGLIAWLVLHNGWADWLQIG